MEAFDAFAVGCAGITPPLAVDRAESTGGRWRPCGARATSWRACARPCARRASARGAQPPERALARREPSVTTATLAGLTFTRKLPGAPGRGLPAGGVKLPSSATVAPP